MIFKQAQKVLLLLISLFIFNPVFSQAENQGAIPEKPNKIYISVYKRARLGELRSCVSDTPGASWKECRFNCYELCDEIMETYHRGVCNGVLIQSCCGEHPSGCK